MARILLVDDDVDMQEINRLILKKRGHEVTVAYSAAEAIKTFDESVPDIVVLDVMMEYATAGIDLSKDIHSRYPDIPIIMMTGIRGKLDPALQNFDPNSIDLPIVKFLDKPVPGANLADEVEALLKQRRAER